MTANLFPVLFGGSFAATMSSIEIASLTGSRHDKVKQSIDRLAAKGVIVQPPAGIEQEADSMGRLRSTEVYIFSGVQGRRDSTIVVAQLCPEFTARIVDRWQELESQQFAPPPVAALATPATEQAAIALMVAESTARMMRLQGSSLLGYMGRVTERLAPEIVGALPNYAVNEPAGQQHTGSSEPTFSLTELLKRHGAGVSAMAMNKRLQAAGIIERMTRPSSKGGMKAFWAITEKGMAYGRNLCSPKNEKEVAPAFFASRFEALMAQVG